MSSTCFTWSLRQLAKLFCLASITPYLSVRVLFQGKHFLTFSTFSSLENLRRCTMCLFSNILCFFYTNHNDGNCRWFWTQKTVAIFEMIWFSFIDYRRHLAEKTPVVRGCLWIMPFYLSLRLFYVEMRAFCCNTLALKLSMLISAVIFLLVLFHPLLMGQGGSHFSGRHQIRLSQVIMSDPLNHSLSRLKNGFTAFLSKHKHCFVFWCIYICW